MNWMAGLKQGVLFTLALGVALAGGCVSFTQDYPSVAAYALDVTRPAGEPAGAVDGSVLKVRSFRTDSRFSGGKLIYRQTGDRWTSDFYHEWFVSPGAMVAENVENWLTASGIFDEVVKASSMAEATHQLEGTIEALYGDFSQPESPKAVVGLNLVLLRTRRPDAREPDILLNQHYQTEIPLEDSTVKALLGGYEQGLRQILSEAEADMVALGGA